MSPAMRSKEAAADDRTRQRSLSFTQRILKSGVKYAAGSDMCWAYPGKTRGEASALMFSHLHEAGMPSLDILRAVTSNAAEMLGWQDRVGAVGPAGKFAAGPPEPARSNSFGGSPKRCGRRNSMPSCWSSPRPRSPCTTPTSRRWSKCRRRQRYLQEHESPLVGLAPHTGALDPESWHPRTRSDTTTKRRTTEIPTRGRQRAGQVARVVLQCSAVIHGQELRIHSIRPAELRCRRNSGGVRTGALGARGAARALTLRLQERRQLG